MVINGRRYGKCYSACIRQNNEVADDFIDYLGDLYTETNDGMWKDQDGCVWEWSEVVDENFNNFYEQYDKIDRKFY